MEKAGKLGAKKWFSFILVGLIGQLAWAIENNYINLWVFSQSGKADFINWMTIASAIVATLTTFLMGALSDKLGKRKLFIALGYTIWGIFVFAFGLGSLKNMEAMVGSGSQAILWVGIANVAVDCVMTFFGSTGNDACFNAMVTEQADEKNRPFVETVLSILPLIAMVLMMGIGLVLGVPGSQGEGETMAEYAARIAPSWLYFFLICGIVTTSVKQTPQLVSSKTLPMDSCRAQLRRTGVFTSLCSRSSSSTSPSIRSCLITWFISKAFPT